MSVLLDLCRDQPVREVADGEVVVAEGEDVGRLFVVVGGSFSVTRNGLAVATVDEPGAVIGEISTLLQTVAGATVTAQGPGRIHVIDDPQAFLAERPAALHEIARLLAVRLNRLTAFLGDVVAQYSDTDGNLGLLGDVLTALSFSPDDTVEPGSERDPDPAF